MKDHLKPVPGREGTYSYESRNPSPSFSEILERISTPVIIKRKLEQEVNVVSATANGNCREKYTL